MVIFKRFEHHRTKTAWAFEFGVLTLLSGGVYAVLWLAAQGPRLSREAFHLRALNHLHPETNPSPWPWLRKASLAWVSSCIGLFFLSLLVAGLSTPLLRNHPHWVGYIGLVIVLPVMVMLAEGFRLVFQVMKAACFPPRVLSGLMEA